MFRRQFDEILQSASAGTTIAVAGASNHPLKYGYIITQFLNIQGYTVWPVTDEDEQIQRLTTYNSLMSLPAAPDILNVVTPPRTTLHLIRDAVTLGCKKVWLQPGSFNGAVLREAAMSGMLVESQRCIMVVSAQWVGEPAAPTR